MLVIEGADGVGKTTLAQTMVERLNRRGESIERGHVYQHLSRPDRRSFHPVHGHTRLMCRQVVQDRLHMSELAYSLVTQRDTKLTPQMYSLVDSRLRQHAGFTVVLVLEGDDQRVLDALRVRAGNRHEMFDLRTVAEVNKTYRVLANDGGVYDGRTGEQWTCDVDAVLVSAHNGGYRLVHEGRVVEEYETPFGEDTAPPLRLVEKLYDLYAEHYLVLERATDTDREGRVLRCE